jgi:homoserine dehydrogenase
MFTGPGAGEFPTASAVVGDILAIASEFDNCKKILPANRCTHEEYARQTDVSETSNSYYMSITAKNVTGTIGVIGTICGAEQINLSSILQKGINEDGTANIVVITEVCLEKNIQKAISQMEAGGNIKVNNLIRVME